MKSPYSRVVLNQHVPGLAESTPSLALHWSSGTGFSACTFQPSSVRPLKRDLKPASSATAGLGGRTSARHRNEKVERREEAEGGRVNTLTQRMRGLRFRD